MSIAIFDFRGRRRTNLIRAIRHADRAYWQAEVERIIRDVIGWPASSPETEAEAFAIRCANRPTREVTIAERNAASAAGLSINAYRRAQGERQEA